MNIFRQFFNAGMSGWHSGKGHKCTRQGNFDEALRRYILALQYSDPEGNDAVLLECIARTQARLAQYEQALNTAERSLKFYKELSGTELADSRAKSVTAFIELLKSQDEGAIQKYLTI